MGLLDAFNTLAKSINKDLGGKWPPQISSYPTGKSQQQPSFVGKSAVQAVNLERGLKVDPFDALYVFTEKHMSELFPPKEPGAKLGVVKVQYTPDIDLREVGNFPVVSIYRLTDNSPHVLVENITFSSAHKTQILSGFGSQFLPVGFGKTPTQISLALRAISSGNYPGGFTAEQMLHTCSTTNYGKFLSNREYYFQGKLTESPCFFLCYLSYEQMVYYFLTVNVGRVKSAQDQLFEYLNTQGVVMAQYRLTDSAVTKKVETWDEMLPLQREG